MKQINDSLGMLIERYAFAVANSCIESAGLANQTELINLCRAVGQSGETTGQNGRRPKPYEWETVLEEPVDWRSVHRQWRMGIIQERIKWHEAYLARLETIVHTTNERLEAVRVSQLNTHHQSRLEAYYEQALGTYRQQLARAKDSYDGMVASLSQ